MGKVVAGIDIREHGTGNVGAANVRETIGAFWAALVALGIFLQGLLPPLAVRRLGGGEIAETGAAVGTIVGYGWPVSTGFKGGRGVGVTTGAAAANSPGGFAVLLSSYALGALLRQTSLGVLLGFVFYVVYVFHSTGSAARRVAAILCLLLISVKRLEGLQQELEKGPSVKVFLDLLLFQRRPGPSSE